MLDDYDLIYLKITIINPGCQDLDETAKQTSPTPYLFIKNANVVVIFSPSPHNTTHPSRFIVSLFSSTSIEKRSSRSRKSQWSLQPKPTPGKIRVR